jgi:hypothetical protein
MAPDGSLRRSVALKKAACTLRSGNLKVGGGPKIESVWKEQRRYSTCSSSKAVFIYESYFYLLVLSCARD